VAGYACLYGGQASQDRAAPGQEPWSRLHGLCPAFFTKFLYFCTPGALILDSKLAAAVSRLSHLPGLVTASGPPAGLDALPLRGLPALDEPDRPGRASGAGTPGNHPFQATDA
jgi:hypothetical protein